MEGVFWFGFGILTGMAALPWVQRLAERARRTLAELELVDPLLRAAPDDERSDPHDTPTEQQGRRQLMPSRIAVVGPGQPDSPRPWPRGGGVHTS